MSTCFICGKEIIGFEDSELFGCDGDRIHKKCLPLVDQKMEMINTMSDEEFQSYMMGITEL